MKRVLALLCASAMTVTGVNLPVNVMSTEASANWAWNATVSESGYEKVPFSNLSAVADSVQTGSTEPNSNGAGAASPGTGAVANIVDGVTSSFWHSNYSDPNSKVTFSGGNLTGRNTLTISFKNSNSESVRGITYLPRQDALGNGGFRRFKIEVKQTGSEDWIVVSQNTEIDYQNADKGNWNQDGRKNEKEILFSQVYDNVEKIKFTVTNSIGERPNEFLSGAEISILKNQKDSKFILRNKLAEIETEMSKNVLVGDEQSGKVYDRTEYDSLKIEAEQLLSSEETTEQALKDMLSRLGNLDYKFLDEVGTGKYLSDMPHISGTTGWNGVTKDQCPDKTGVAIAFRTGEGNKINTYTKGIGAHEPSEIVYDVTGYKKFTADAGIESHQNMTNKVNFIVSTSVDGQQYKEVQRIENVSVSGGLKKINVDFEEGVTKMKLECRPAAEGGRNTMHSCWANAKLYDSIGTKDITLNLGELPLKIGERATLTPTFNPINATDKEVIWNSDKESVATVAQDGEVTANGIGTAIVTVCLTANPKIKAQCTVTVTRDDTALDAAIKQAEDKKREENYADKYTEASKIALESALEDAKIAREDKLLPPEEVQLAVDALNQALEAMEAKAAITIVNGTTETKYYEVGDRVKVVAAQAPAGRKFSHWAVDGKPICYTESYTFTVYKDTRVEAVYIEDSQSVEKTVNVLCNVSYENGMVKFVSKHSVPTDAGYKVLKAGVVATDSKGYAAIQKAGEELTLETTATNRLKRYGVETNYYLANFTQYLRTSFKTTWYAKGYVVYQDSEGVTHTIYSDVAEYTVQ